MKKMFLVEVEYENIDQFGSQELSDAIEDYFCFEERYKDDSEWHIDTRELFDTNL